MHARSSLWRFLLLSFDWSAPHAKDERLWRIAVSSDLTAVAPAEMDRAAPRNRYLPIECADGHLDWASVREKCANGDGTITLYLEPL